MSSSQPVTITDSILNPLAECFTPEVARRIVEFRPDMGLQARLDELRSKANEGTLTDQERADYAEFVETLDFMALLKTKARARLATAAE